MGQGGIQPADNYIFYMGMVMPIITYGQASL